MKILLIIYDNDSLISWFPQGMGYIAAVCRNAGHEVKIYNQDVYHWSEEHLTNYLNKNDFDIVGVGACGGYYQYRKILKISEAVNKSENRKNFKYLLGGHLVSPEPKFFLNKMSADVIVIGEGEETIIDLINHFIEKKSLNDVLGIAYLDNKNCIINPRRPLIKNIDDLPMPAWDLFPMDHYTLLRLPNIKNNERCMPVLSGRGCTFACNFCYRMDKGFRPRSINKIIEEIQILKEKYNVSYIAFSDELLMSSTERTIEICKAFIDAGLNIKWDCNGRLNYAKPEVLKLMHDAGCVFINYGIECMDDQILINMHKGLTTKLIEEGIKNTLDAGISPGFNIIFGNIDETKKTLQNGVDFLLKYDDHSQFRTIRPVTPYPGSELYYLAIQKGLIKDCEDFYENKHTNSDLMTVNFTKLTDDEFYDALYNANKTLINSYLDTQKLNYIKIEEKLYFKKDSSFRGFRQS